MIDTLYKPFRKWSACGSVYLYGDFHFGDADRECMGYHLTDEEQIELINKEVHRADTIVCLGDVGAVEKVAQLKAGYKVLLCGNHDVGVVNYEPYFDEIYTGPLFIAEKILLSHEPCPIDGVVNIHAHDHGGQFLTNTKHGRLINCAANIIGFKPQSLGKLIKQGILARIDTRHRLCIDKATERRANKQ